VYNIVGVTEMARFQGQKSEDGRAERGGVLGKGMLPSHQLGNAGVL